MLFGVDLDFMRNDLLGKHIVNGSVNEVQIMLLIFMITYP